MSSEFETEALEEVSTQEAKLKVSQNVLQRVSRTFFSAGGDLYVVPEVESLFQNLFEFSERAEKAPILAVLNDITNSTREYIEAVQEKQIMNELGKPNDLKKDAGFLKTIATLDADLKKRITELN